MAVEPERPGKRPGSRIQKSGRRKQTFTVTDLYVELFILGADHLTTRGGGRVFTSDFFFLHFVHISMGQIVVVVFY